MDSSTCYFCLRTIRFVILIIRCSRKRENWDYREDQCSREDVVKMQTNINIQSCSFLNLNAQQIVFSIFNKCINQCLDCICHCRYRGEIVCLSVCDQCKTSELSKYVTAAIGEKSFVSRSVTNVKHQNCPNMSLLL